MGIAWLAQGHMEMCTGGSGRGREWSPGRWQPAKERVAVRRGVGEQRERGPADSCGSQVGFEQR